MNDAGFGDPSIAVQILAWPDNPSEEKIDMFGQQPANLTSDHRIRTFGPSSGTLISPTIGLIDPCRLTQDCLARAFSNLHPKSTIRAFITAKDCLAEASISFDMMVYYLHGIEIFESTTMQGIAEVCQAFPTAPVIVISDADCSSLSKITRAVLKCGVRGFIPSRMSDLGVTLAAARLIKEGGVYVPTCLLPTGQSSSQQMRRKRLSLREDEVLRHLQQGKANKIIAYELGMSASTVKVHIRNIMRKLGATNRTQVAYIARELSKDVEDLEAINAKPLRVSA